MFDHIGMSDEVPTILSLAGEEARNFRHEYVGTEHVLLALIRQEDGVAATVLRSRGIDVARIRSEVERLVHRGPTEVTQSKLPLTPRVRQALTFAADDARMVGLPTVDTLHVLIGLSRDPDGVAGTVLSNLGLGLSELRAEVFKVRQLQMKFVERVVRPLKANIARKRKMRDELLAHLSEIYDEELVKCDDPEAAVLRARERFGDPIELTVELQATVPQLEQWEARLEPVFGWRPPETVVRWMTRVAIQVGLIMLVASLAAGLSLIAEFGWTINSLSALRPMIAGLVVLPISVFGYGVCYFNIRDHFTGAFSSQKSWVRAIAWAGVLTAVTIASGFLFFWICYGSFAPAAAAFYPIIWFGFIWAMGGIAFARIYGPQEIRDATWALLDLTD